MAAGNLLLLLVGDVSPAKLRDALAARVHPPERVHVVAPMVVTPLDWLATAEDHAHREAEMRALDAEWTLADQAETGGEAGIADPVQAVEDALRSFPADEILIAGEQADPDLERALAPFGLPVARLEDARYPARRSWAFRALRALAAGHGSETPFILFLGVNSALALLALVISLLVVLILWLAGAL